MENHKIFNDEIEKIAEETLKEYVNKIANETNIKNMLKDAALKGFMISNNKLAIAERTGREFDCRINIESVTIKVSSEADISSIAKELNQLVVMENRKGGMGA